MPRGVKKVTEDKTVATAKTKTTKSTTAKKTTSTTKVKPVERKPLTTDFDKIKYMFDTGVWKENQVRSAVERKKITAAQFKSITNKTYKK